MNFAEIEFGEPHSLSSHRPTLEVEFPYSYNYTSRIIKVSASEALVARWERGHKDIMAEMQNLALEYLKREISTASLGDYEVLTLTTSNVAK